jgi:hypothetical protein
MSSNTAALLAETTTKVEALLAAQARAIQAQKLERKNNPAPAADASEPSIGNYLDGPDEAAVDISKVQPPLNPATKQGHVGVVWLKPSRVQARNTSDAFTTALVDQTRFVNKQASVDKTLEWVNKQGYVGVDCETAAWLDLPLTIFYNPKLSPDRGDKFNVLATNLASRLETGAADRPLCGTVLVVCKDFKGDLDGQQLCGVLFMIHNMQDVYTASDLTEKVNLEETLAKLKASLGPM